MIERKLRQFRTTIDAIQGLQRTARCPVSLLQSRAEPFPKRRCLLSQADAQETIDREGCIANPCVTVIPVANATDRFRQTARRRRDDGSSRFIGEKLERERRAMHGLPPSSRIRALGEP